MVISTNRIAPVASVLAEQRDGVVSADRRSAMIPEPITQANRKKAPTPSAASAPRRLSGRPVSCSERGVIAAAQRLGQAAFAHSPTAVGQACPSAGLSP